MLLWSKYSITSYLPLFSIFLFGGRNVNVISKWSGHAKQILLFPLVAFVLAKFMVDLSARIRA